MVGERAAALSRTLDLLTELTGPGERERLDAELGATTIHLVASPRDLRTNAGQVALATVAMLCVRMGMRVDIDLPNSPCLVDLPAMHSGSFREALLGALSQWFPAETSRPAPERHVVVACGRAAPASADRTIRLVAMGRRAGVRHDTEGGLWAPQGSLVALAAAGLACGEILKVVLAAFPTVPAQYIVPETPSWSMPFDMPERVVLGRIEAISAGAIIQNLLWALAADQRMSGSIRLFDRDRLELSNLNRCPIAVLDGVGRPKVDVIADLMPPRLEIVPVAAHLDAATAGSLDPGSIVIVGADDVAARHAAQRLVPEWLGIGATSHLLAYVTEHRPGGPCAGCAHPRVGDDLGTIPTISIVSFWAGFLLAVRVIANALGRPASPSGAATTFWPLRASAIIDHGLVVNRACPLHPVATFSRS